MLGELGDRCLCGRLKVHCDLHKSSNACVMGAHVIPEPAPASVARSIPSKREVARLFPGADCYYCGDKAENIDHLTPRSKGGGNNLENKVPSCYVCNQMKGNLRLDEFVARMERVLQTLRSKKVIQYPIQFGGDRLWVKLTA